MEKLGRSRAHMKILPACFVVTGDTVEEARAKRTKLDSLVDYANAIASLSIALGHDASKFDPDAPLPDNIPESNASKSGRQRAIELGRRENLTVRQLAQRLGGYSGLAMVGTPKTVADEMEEWLCTNGSDGFTVMFPTCPAGLTISSHGSFPSCSAVACFAATTRGRRYVNISACRARTIASFPIEFTPVAGQIHCVHPVLTASHTGGPLVSLRTA